MRVVIAAEIFGAEDHDSAGVLLEIEEARGYVRFSSVRAVAVCLLDVDDSSFGGCGLDENHKRHECV